MTPSSTNGSRKSTAVSVDTLQLKAVLRAYTKAEATMEAFRKIIAQAAPTCSLAKLPAELILMINDAVYSVLQEEYLQKWTAIYSWYHDGPDRKLGIAYCIALSSANRNKVRRYFDSFAEDGHCQGCRALNSVADDERWRAVGRYVTGSEEQECEIAHLRCEECQKCLSYIDDTSEPHIKTWISIGAPSKWPPLDDQHQPDDVVDFENPFQDHSQISDMGAAFVMEYSDVLWSTMLSFKAHMKEQIHCNTFFTKNERAVLQHFGMDCWTRLEWGNAEHFAWKTLLVFTKLPPYLHIPQFKDLCTPTIEDRLFQRLSPAKLQKLQRVAKALCVQPLPGRLDGIRSNLAKINGAEFWRSSRTQTLVVEPKAGHS